jgi:hypothetical protein
MNQPIPSSAETYDVSTRIRTQEKIAVFLALVAGYTDSTGLIRWKTYVSFMSGNTTQLALLFPIIHPALSLLQVL